jgi:hypothetical protein
MSFAQLLYVSRSLLPQGDTDSALAAILVSARRSNLALDLTGCLASWDAHFVQILEGSPASIERAMQRIEADPRHTDISIRMRREVGTRSFPNWRMALADKRTAMRPIGNPVDLPVVILLSELMRLAEGEVLPALV